MVRLNRNDILAEYYLRAAGVAAVWIDADGHVGAQDVASIDVEPDSTVYCCARGVHFTLAYRLYEWKHEAEAKFRARAAALEIEAGAKRRLADEYDAAQERGEIAGPSDRHSSSRAELNKATASDVGLTHTDIHEARVIRDAEIAVSGIVRRRAIDVSAIAAKLEDLAELGGVGLTPHHVAVDRAMAAVAAVNDTIDKMASTGDLKAFNRAFKEARKVDPALKYVDYLERKKAEMLEAFVTGAAG